MERLPINQTRDNKRGIERERKIYAGNGNGLQPKNSASDRNVDLSQIAEHTRTSPPPPHTLPSSAVHRATTFRRCGRLSYLMVLIQFLQCVSKQWTTYTIHRGLRTAASQVQFSAPLDDYDEDHSDRTRAPPSSSPSVLSKRDWMTYTPKPPPSLKPHSESAAQDPPLSLEEDERPPIHYISKKTIRKPTPTAARLHRERMKNSFPEGWSPPHKLSRQAMDGLRVLHAHDPETFSTPLLAERFRVSPEAIRRILRSKWEPSPDQRARLLRRELKEKQAWIEAKRVAEREEYKVLRNGRVNQKRAEDKLTFI